MSKSALEAAIEEGVKSGRLVGGVLAAAHNGEIVCHRAEGLADREANITVQLETQFRLASLSKAVTAVTCLSLVDRGRISLEAAVSDYLPGFRPFDQSGEAPRVSIHHLLTHTAGLSYETAGGVPNGLTDDGIEMSQAITLIGSKPLVSPPGKRWQYSIATDVLGAVIAAVDGKSLGHAMEEAVTGPLGMEDTSFTPNATLAKAYADGPTGPMLMPDEFPIYTTSDDTFLSSPSRATSKHSYQSGGAGLIGTAGDYLKFLEGVRLEHAILRPTTWAIAKTNSIGSTPRKPVDVGQRFCYLGGLIDDPILAKTPMSRGSITWGGVYGNSWWIDFEANLSVVLLTNTATEGLEGQTSAKVRLAAYASA